MLQVLVHDSQAIKDFPTNEITKREIPVLLPPRYEQSKDKRYPVIFFLAGWGARSSKYLDTSSVFGVSIPTEIHSRMLAGKMPEAILVFPDGSTRMGCSQYINSPSYGNFMDYICDEIVDLIDQKFRTLKQPESRAVVGHSSGGFGALMIGMERPDRFSVIGSAAGDSFFEASVLPGLTQCIAEIEKKGGVENFIHFFCEHPNPGSLGGSVFHSMYTLSLAACYAPRPQEKPLYGELFFDLRTGRIKEDVWQEYLKWDPIRRIHDFKLNLQKLKFILLDCGLNDEFAAQWGHRQIADTLKDWNIQYELIEYPGKHSGNNWRFADRCERLLKEIELS